MTMNQSEPDLIRADAQDYVRKLESQIQQNIRNKGSQPVLKKLRRSTDLFIGR